MNIIFGIGDYTAKGGTERVTIALANALSRKMNVSILTLGGKNVDPIFRVKEEVKIINLKNTKSFHSRKGGIFGLIFDIIYILKNMFPIRKKILEKSADYITGTDIKLTFLFYLASLGTKTKVIATEHFDYGVPCFVLKKLRSLYYKKLHNVVTLTDEDIDNYKKIGAKVLVIPNIASFKVDQVSLMNKKKIISVGRLTYQKGYDLLIESWEKLEKKFPEWNLEIFGEGEDKEKLLNDIKSRDLRNIKLKGFSNNIKEEYLESSIYVMSSRYEGLPTVLIEALSNGIPCVSFACPTGPKSIIKNKINGYLAENGKIEDLAEKLELIISNEKLRNEMAKNAPKSIEQFSEGRVVEKWEKILI